MCWVVRWFLIMVVMFVSCMLSMIGWLILIWCVWRWFGMLWLSVI